MIKLTSKQKTLAYQRFARRHGYYVRTVRNMTLLKMAALIEYRSFLLYGNGGVRVDPE